MKPPSNPYIRVFGWAGVVAMIFAYIFYGMGVFTADSLLYQFLNLFGALGILTISIYKKVWQTAALGVFWAVIAIYSLYVYLPG